MQKISSALKLDRLELNKETCIVSTKLSDKITEEDIMAFLQHVIRNALSRRNTIDPCLHFNQRIWREFLTSCSAVDKNDKFAVDEKDKYLPTITKIAKFVKDNLPFDVNKENELQNNFFDEKQQNTKYINFVFPASFYLHKNLEDEKSHDIQQSNCMSVYNTSSRNLGSSNLLVDEKQEIEHKITEKELQLKLDEPRSLLLRHQLNGAPNIKNKKPTIFDKVAGMLDKLFLEILKKIKSKERDARIHKNFMTARKKGAGMSSDIIHIFKDPSLKSSYNNEQTSVSVYF
ncbi:MAG: hypothetical protein COC15_03710 [Legionellales bacterium]|nr:MAG: hypothetical protein COC15_03710 [Legionellales bacterium]